MPITPSGVAYDDLAPEDIAALTLEGEYGAYEGRLAPSSEWRFHLDITRARPDVGAIVHAHSTYATMLAICRKDIPACHYMIAASGGTTIRCADYATYGTKELSDNALRALEGRSCCLLANHGMIATGASRAKPKAGREGERSLIPRRATPRPGRSARAQRGPTSRTISRRRRVARG